MIRVLGDTYSPLAPWREGRRAHARLLAHWSTLLIKDGALPCTVAAPIRHAWVEAVADFSRQQTESTILHSDCGEVDRERRKVMKLLFLPQVFPPEAHPTAVMFRQLAQGLATRGHEVTVACGYPNHPGGGVFGGYRKRLITRETDGGIQIVRSWHLTTTRRTLPARAAAMTSQTLGAVVAANWTPRPNVVVSVGPPLVGPLAAAACAHRFQVPLVTVIFDIYPDVAINAGKLRNPLLVSFARSLESLAYRLSTKVIVLSDGFRSALITKGVPAAKIDVIPVWLEEDEIRPLPRDTRFRRELWLDASTFVVLYAGTIGLVSGAHIVADAAKLVRNRRVVFLFVGQGDARSAVQSRVRELGLTNVRFVEFQPRKRLAEVQATADLGLVTLAPGCARTSVPSKVVAYLAAGRPILASVDLDSDTATTVTRAGGVVVRPGDATALARAVDEIAASANAEAGEKARAEFLREHTKEAAVARYIATFEAALH